MIYFIRTLVLLLLVCEILLVGYRCKIFNQLKKKTFPTMIGLSAMFTSAVFTAMAVILMFLFDRGEPVVCQLSALSCIFLYAGTKLQLYIFFIERMHIVHKNPSQTRMQSPLYIFNMCLLLPYAGIVTVLFMYQYNDVNDHKKCIMGLPKKSTLPTIVYDTMFSVYSIAVFVWPLYKSRASGKIIAVGKRNIIGSVVSTVSSFVNVFLLFYREHQMADICLMNCSLDVMVNVLVMNYLISGGGEKRKIVIDESVYSCTLPDPSKRAHFLHSIHHPSRVYPSSTSDTLVVTTLALQNPEVTTNEVEESKQNDDDKHEGQTLARRSFQSKALASYCPTAECITEDDNQAIVDGEP